MEAENLYMGIIEKYRMELEIPKALLDDKTFFCRLIEECRKEKELANQFYIYSIYFIMYVYCVYPAVSKSPKQLPDCLKRAETSFVFIDFNCVFYHVLAHTATVFSMNQY